MAKENMIGMDIGNSTLKMTVCQDGVPEQFIRVPLPDNLVSNDDITSWDAMGQFIKSSLSENKVRTRNVALSLPDRHLIVHRVSMPLMTIGQLKVNLPYEFRAYINENKDQYIYDYSVVNIKKDPDKPGKGEMDLIAVAMERDLLAKYKDMFGKVGLKLCTVSPEAFALKNIIDEYEEEREITGKRDYAILDLGAKSVKIHFFTDGVFDITRVLDPGCDEFIRMIASILDVDQHVARLKFENNVDGIQESEDMVSRYSDLAVEIMRTMNFYRYNHQDSNLDSLYVCGGGVCILRLLQSIQESLDVTLRSSRKLIPDEDPSFDRMILCPQALGVAWE